MSATCGRTVGAFSNWSGECHMRRREFITLLGSAAAAWPLAARAQQPGRRRRIGVLMGAFAASDPNGQAALAAFVTSLQGFGWAAGSSAQIEVRWISPEVQHGKTEAAELVAWAPDVLFCSSSLATDVLSRSTRTIPIVFTQVVDPIGSGRVKSYARLAGNLTGFPSFEAEVGGKWLDVLKEIAPRVSRVSVLFYPETFAPALWHSIEAAAAPLAIKASPAAVHDRTEIEQAITMVAGQTDSGLVVLPTPVTNSNRGLISDLAARHHLPAVYPWRFHAISGGLASYGPDNLDLYWRAASYVNRILRGEKPADLPVQVPTKYELVINLLGLDVPFSLQQLADEVIE
jgi:putative tryptophan/tyrosine transport system substrate-binding protein